MHVHCLPIIAEDIREDRPLAARASVASSAASACCRQSWALAKRCRILSSSLSLPRPVPPPGPHPLLLLLLHRPLWLACLQLNHPRAKLVPLRLNRLCRVPGPLGILLGLLLGNALLPPRLQKFPLSHHCPLLPLWLGMLLQHPIHHLSSGVGGRDTRERWPIRYAGAADIHREGGTAC